MSWHSELLPPSLTLSNLVKELSKADSEYKRAGLSVQNRVVFLGLRVVQRVAYNVGWAVGNNRWR